jgi:predicted DNA-binding WGR domain protein
MKISLRNESVTGEKMWEAEVTPQGVRIRYGAVGKKPRTQLVPLAACKNRNATDEAVKRAEAKRKDGYWDVDPRDNTDPQTAVASTRSDVVKKDDLGSIKKNTWF